MKFAKELFMGLGVVAFMAVLLMLSAPKSVHALVATLVQIVPGSATHVGQNEGNLVSLVSFSGQAFYAAESPSSGSTDGFGTTPYVVPAGYTLVVTDYSWILKGSYSNGNYACDVLGAGTISSKLFEQYNSSKSCAIADPTGTVSNAAHFTTGIRFASGLSLVDFGETFVGSAGVTSVQGYLVPN